MLLVGLASKLRQNLNANFKIHRNQPRKVHLKMRNDFFERAERRHRIFGFFFWLTFTIVLGAILSYWAFIGYTVWTLKDRPEAIGNYVGRILKGFEQGTGK